MSTQPLRSRLTVRLQSAVVTICRVGIRATRPMFRGGLPRRLLSLALLANLLIWPFPDASVRAAISVVSETVTSSAQRLDNTVHLASHSLGSLFKRRKAQPMTLAQRQASVASVEILPKKFVGYLQERTGFSAIPKGAFSGIVQGAKPEWTSSNPEVVKISEAGQATLLGPGHAWIACRYGTAEQRVPVVVRAGTRSVQTVEQWNADQNSLNLDGSVNEAADGALSRVIDSFEPTVHAQNGGGNGPGDYLWDYEPNLVGNPRNHCIEPSRIGSILPESSNFNWSTPVVSLQGRGLNLNLSLYYNSRIWMQDGSTIYYAPLPSFPATGFYLGCGYIATYTSSFNPSDTGYLFIDTDGTPRYLGQGSATSTGTYTTSDGSYITFTGSAASGGQLTFPNGNIATMSVVNGYLQMTMLQDTNGNYITYSYESSAGGFSPLALASATDTLGREVVFGYSGTSLANVTAPAVGGGTTTLLNFAYSTNTLSYNFSGLTPSFPGTNSTSTVLSTVVNPTTESGYVFTYSGYGMVDTVSINRQMNGSNGVQSASAGFNFPSGSTQITSAPAFTEYTESPGGTYTYSTSTNSSAETITFSIARPDGSTLQLTRSTNASAAAYGLMTESQIFNSSNASMRNYVYSYAPDPGGAEEISNLIVYDDTNTPVQTNYDYNSVGMIEDKREFGFQVSGAWDVRRRTHVSYTTAGGAQKPSAVDVYNGNLQNNDSDDVLVAETTYTYDDYSALGGSLGVMQNYGGNADPPGHLSAYNSTSLTKRGNLTGETQWYDLTNNLSITRLAQIDIFGGTVVAQLSCCDEKSMTMTESTYWSNASQVTKGASGGPQLTTTNTYDFNTSLQTEMTDPDGLTTSYQYDANLRPTITSLPTGATTTIGYSDTNLYATANLAYTSAGSSQSLTTTSYTDGWGDVTETVDAAGNTVVMDYNAMGQLSQKTTPFAPGGAGYWTLYAYDALGRLTQSTFNPDKTTTTVTYSGSTMTATDPAGRQMVRKCDGLARLIELDEQNPSTGGLTDVTTYSYDCLDDLIGMYQNGQTRSWAYDAIQRKTYENIPEQTASITDSNGNKWTSAWAYTDFSAVATYTDARGMTETETYDTMNRLIQISYNTSNAPGVASTPTVTYNYDNSSDSTQGELMSVNVAGVYTEAYGYDGYERPSSVTDTISGYNYTTSYQYSEANQVTQITYPSGRALPFLYDSYGRLNSVGGSTGGNGGYNPGYLGSITYNSAEQPTGYTLGNGVTEALSYNNHFQLSGTSATIGSTSLMNLTYSYSAAAGQLGTGTQAANADQVVAQTGTMNGTTENFSYYYDLDRRLVSASLATNNSSTALSYGWDVFGNRLTETNTATGSQIQDLTMAQSGGVTNNRISSLVYNGQTYNYTYDAAGNVTSDGSGNTYTYDAADRLVSVSGNLSIQNSYDFENRRVVCTEGGVTTDYVWQGNKVLAEMNGSTGGPSIDYIPYGNSFIATVQSSGTVTYVLRDRLSERLVLNSSGAVEGVMATLPFGQDFAESGTQEKHHFTTYDRDSTTGLDYAINRSYNPALGRFLRVDPGGTAAYSKLPQGSNRYSYVAGDPINSVDPLGLDADTGNSTDTAEYWASIMWLTLADLTGMFGLPHYGELMGGNDGGGAGGADPDHPCNLGLAQNLINTLSGNIQGILNQTFLLAGQLSILAYGNGGLSGLYPVQAANISNDGSQVASIASSISAGAPPNADGAAVASDIVQNIDSVLNGHLLTALPMNVRLYLSEIMANVAQTLALLQLTANNFNLAVPALGQCNNLSIQQQNQLGADDYLWQLIQQSIQPLYKGLSGLLPPT
ncbi:MAG TPA: RHS repeat-associated core domain-containing protein [Blastocatellia bacterium]